MMLRKAQGHYPGRLKDSNPKARRPKDTERKRRKDCLVVSDHEQTENFIK